MDNASFVKPKKARKRLLKVSEIQDYTIALFPILYILLFSYVPMVGLIIAFKDYRYDKGMFGSDWVGFENFISVFGNMEFPRVLRNTVMISFLKLITSFPLKMLFTLMQMEIRLMIIALL